MGGHDIERIDAWCVNGVRVLYASYVYGDTAFVTSNNNDIMHIAISTNSNVLLSCDFSIIFNVSHNNIVCVCVYIYIYRYAIVLSTNQFFNKRLDIKQVYLNAAYGMKDTVIY